MVILYASHIFGCLWWVTSRYDDGESWWARDGLDRDDAKSTYIASLYWAATTITTVRRLTLACIGANMMAALRGQTISIGAKEV